jgi:hypothetical protein
MATPRVDSTDPFKVVFGSAWPTGFDPSLLGTASNGATVAITGAIATVNFSTIPINGDRWSITIDGATKACAIGTIVDGVKIDSIEKAAQYLADQISLTAGYTAGVEEVAVGESKTYTVVVTKLVAGTITVSANAGHRYSYYFAPVNPNIRVVEAEQVDTLNVYNGNSPANDVGTLTENRLYGLGMGPDTVIGDREVQGGITYHNLEALNITLGSGDDQLTI